MTNQYKNIEPKFSELPRVIQEEILGYHDVCPNITFQGKECKSPFTYRWKLDFPNLKEREADCKKYCLTEAFKVPPPDNAKAVFHDPDTGKEVKVTVNFNPESQPNIYIKYMEKGGYQRPPKMKYSENYFRRGDSDYYFTNTEYEGPNENVSVFKQAYYEREKMSDINLTAEDVVSRIEHLHSLFSSDEGTKNGYFLVELTFFGQMENDEYNALNTALDETGINDFYFNDSNVVRNNLNIDSDIELDDGLVLARMTLSL